MLAMPKEARTPKSHRLPIPTAAAAAASTTRNTPSWTKEDDDLLIQARASGKNWNEIAPKYFKSKTPNACRKRHERLMEKRNAEDWDGLKLETLATAYFEVREQMWGILAERLGEKWSLLEQKCMEKGLKNLNQASRSAHKKQGTSSDHHDDSGVSCSDPKETLDDHHADHMMPHSSYPNYNIQQREPTIKSMLIPNGPTYNSHHP
jgi:hypothetical protein